MDAQGAEVAQRFTQAAGATFPNAVDRAQGLWELYGFDVIPNGFFVDEAGVLRYIKIGGFEVRNTEDAQAIETLLASPGSAGAVPPTQAANFETLEEALRRAEEAAQTDPENIEKLLTLAERRVEARQFEKARRDFESVLAKNPRSARALMGLASIYLDQGDRAKAAETLKKARAIAPDNWIIRKQIWAIEHPEQFYPAINADWQKQQIQKEKSGR